MNKETMKAFIIIMSIFFVVGFYNCGNKNNEEKSQINQQSAMRAQETLDSIYSYYSVANQFLLRENYPFSDDYKASYTLSGNDAPNSYSYLWPYSGMLSATVAQYGATQDENILQLLNQKIIPGLNEYYDKARQPMAYASYIQSAPPSDRFYDDNVWLGIDFTDLYMFTQNKGYLDTAKIIWNFVESGRDKILGDGIYWCEQAKTSKNTCSNAPGAVFALKLFEATKDSIYYEAGKQLYQWTKENLQDPSDYLYYDNINLDGKVNRTKYEYNSGQMLQAATLLYNLTDDKKYYNDAKNIARAGANFFFKEVQTPNGDKMMYLKNSDIWFIAVMMRGYLELYEADQNGEFMEMFKQNLDNAWVNIRNPQGLFNTDWSGKKQNNQHWLLTQAAMAEMYANLQKYENLQSDIKNIK